MKNSHTTTGTWAQISSDNDGKIYRVTVKYYDEPSAEYGIDGGRISKLCITSDDGTWLANYDRGWDVYPADEIEPLYQITLARYN